MYVFLAGVQMVCFRAISQNLTQHLFTSVSKMDKFDYVVKLHKKTLPAKI